MEYRIGWEDYTIYERSSYITDQKLKVIYGSYDADIVNPENKDV